MFLCISAPLGLAHGSPVFPPAVGPIDQSRQLLDGVSGRFGVDNAAEMTKIANSADQTRQGWVGSLFHQREAGHENMIAREHHQVTGADPVRLARQQQKSHVPRHAFSAGQIECGGAPHLVDPVHFSFNRHGCHCLDFSLAAVNAPVPAPATQSQQPP